MVGGAKRIWVIANFKSHKNISEALDWVSKVGPKIEKRDNLKVVVCPEFVSLEEVRKAVSVGHLPLLVGSQDLSPFPEGPFTGEEPAEDLKGIADLAILGHSERRQKFAETDQMVADKVAQANAQGIIPLVCVQSEQTVVPQGARLLAYEPPSSISSSPGAVPDDPEDAVQVASVLKQRYGDDLEVLYGGSVTSENAKVYLSKESLSGLLIGAASLDPEEFLKIVEIAYLV